VVVHSFGPAVGADPGLTVAAVPVRAGVRDVLVARGGLSLDRLGPAATVGTSSPRRSAALLRRRPDLRIVPLRGNVATRLLAVATGALDAIVLAEAGLQRLGLRTPDMSPLDPDLMLPAPAQGALAVECRGGAPAGDLRRREGRAPRPGVTAARRARRGGGGVHHGRGALASGAGRLS
jgi:hydroxymethylbilane synthase